MISLAQITNNQNVELAKLRNVPENERIKSKADIDCYFRGGSLK